MNTNKEQFPKLNKEEWISLIEKSLKNGEINDFSWHPDQYIAGLPYAHREDVAKDIPPLISLKDKNEWLVGWVLQNNKIPENLEGFDAVYCEVPILQKEQFQNILRINPSWKEVTLFLTEDDLESQLKSWKESFIADAKPAIQIAVPYEKLAKIDCLELMSLRTSLNLPFHLLVLMEKSGEKSLVREWGEFFATLVSKVEKLDKEDLRKDFCQILRLGVWVNSAQILFETAQIRALKLLIYNIQKAIGIEVNEVPIQAFISLKSLSKDENHQLILATSAGLAAVMGGVHSLYFRADNMDDDRSRLFKNIQLLLKEEAGLTQVEDPIAGSYAVESLTETLAALVWEQLIK
jgi:hypothetical protein